MQQRQAKDDVACFFIWTYLPRGILPASVCLLAKTVLGQLDTLSEMVLHKLLFFRSCHPMVSTDELYLPYL